TSDPPGLDLPPPEEAQQRGQRQREPAGAEPERTHDVEVVFARGGIVLEAAEDHAVEGGPDFSLGRFHDGEPEIARREFHAVQVAGDPAVGAEDHAHRGMLVLLRLLVVPVTEAQRFGERPDRGVPAGEERPVRGIRSSGVAQRLQISALAQPRFRNAVLGREADRQSVVVLGEPKPALVDRLDHAIQPQLDRRSMRSLRYACEARVTSNGTWSTMPTSAFPISAGMGSGPTGWSDLSRCSMYR